MEVKIRDIKRNISVGICLALICFISFSYGFFIGTGTLPFTIGTKSILPPTMESNVTSEQAEQVIIDSPLDLAPYGEKNNCVEMAFLAARQLWWAGYPATVVKIDFSDGTSHMLVGVPTSDAGWKFLEPQNNSWVNLNVGGMYFSKSITGLYVLTDFVWAPLEGVR